MDVMVEAQRIMQVEKLLREREIYYEVTVNDTAVVSHSPHRARSPMGIIQRPRSPIKRAMDWKDFYPLHVIYNFMDFLEVQFPSTCTVSCIGKSVEGRDIKMLKISNSDASNTAVWLDGAIHSREWISTSVVTYIADHLARNFDELPGSITNKDWYFVPIVNPDGYHHTHILDRMWRKNRARVGNNITGVDLNRNFSHFWGRGAGECSSGDPYHINYRGTEPFSEPESAAVKDLILYSGTPFKIFLTFHSYSEVISFPWCYTADPCMDYVTLLEGGTIMAKAIYETNGRMYKVGNFKDLMYYACGTSIDWSYGVARIPFSYLVELRSKEHRFLLPKEQILDCCREVLNGIKALAQFVDTKKCLNHAVISKRKSTM
ncbi:carboxypeptidase B-like [Ostrinia furnacalis]|uniref:carboxypeptidase B-like n=1 Tax=Ostrinia furnacalis TaxID=93504 RepID=UPI00103F9F75|nr:carboxypeptidase B-like [Ostrinia furnacalis]